MILKSIKNWGMKKFVYLALEKLPREFHFKTDMDRYMKARDKEITAALYQGNNIKVDDIIKFVVESGSQFFGDFDHWKYKVTNVLDFNTQCVDEFVIKKLGLTLLEYNNTMDMSWVGKIVYFKKV